MPVHWAGGFMTFFSGILSKACVEFCSDIFSSTWFLKRLVDEDCPPVTSLHLPPPLLNGVASELADLENRDPELYGNVLRGIRQLKVLASGGSTVAPKQRLVWQALFGKPLFVGYGMSESFGVVAYTDYGKRGAYPMDSVGLRMPNVNMKIDNHGEICIKSPVLFKRYISPNPDATKNAFDAEGFFRTGDLGRIEDDIVYLLGRASQDVIRYYLWRIYASEVENALSQIDDVAHAIVLGVKDSGCGKRVAAVVVYRQPYQERRLGLAELRHRLSTECSLQAFKFPTLLKVVSSFGEIPVTEAGKPIKDKIREVYFSEMAIGSGEVEVWTSEPRESVVGARPFDWDGLQR
ncbi:uncharacterized protein N7496_004714 [Penicillium cataractarum]|uniref:AMP-dependent synthetase/ligase domain-containing protein n=1 Tax=Penicillium cataractarum TaxID=2100454 RepID=A0A9W9VF82_9EURO|nr:uncharacterized protein N7496_004714 [Penicillium cataractarum]KAJ5377305.1 hypothetical protein N7496_004714 [Penicillium cataractarum]